MMVVSIEDYKKALGKEAEKLTDAEVRQHMTQQEALARVLFDMWLLNQKVAVKEVKTC